MGDGVAGEEGVAARAPARVDGGDGVLPAVLLAFELLLETPYGLVEGSVPVNEVLELDGRGVALVGHYNFWVART